MGNITKGARRHATPFICPLFSYGQRNKSHLERLYEAIMEDDSSTVKALLADYPVNEPLSAWKDPYIIDLLSFQVYKNGCKNHLQNQAQNRKKYIRSITTNTHNLFHFVQDHASSPIHLAAKYRRERSLQSLLESGADPKIRNNRGYTALHLLLLNLPRTYTVGTSISGKLQRNQPTLQHNTEEHLCTLHKVKHHINPEMSNHKNDSLLHLGRQSEGFQAISILIEHGANVDDTDKFGRTALHIAAESLDEQVTATLITYGANINFANPNCGRTALHLAVCTASFKASRILGINTDCIHLLLNNGAKVNIQDHEGRTAIHDACSGGRKEIVDLLLEYKADVNSLTRDGQSPLFSFLQHRSNLKYTALLNKLLGLSYPLRLRDNQGHLPPGLLFSEFQILKDFLITLSKKLLSLQDICIFTVRRIYGEKNKYRLKNRLPEIVWNSLYNYQDFSKL
ncbi:ankyrin repeat domain-containing protein 61 [Apteryx rowi]|uniref:ankyrin repeat domain-containing protein 61 n=1 Tax=Apteryx rowi TaxID=308060 RepID=UPI000E1D7F95|nr:ankyrin repeat domain-containing protein 61 [Apteryx rowi]